jgi:hypothetical protein
MNPRQLTEAQHGALVRLGVARRWLALRAMHVGAGCGSSTRDIDPDSRRDGNIDGLAVTVTGGAARFDRDQELNRGGGTADE